MNEECEAMKTEVAQLDSNIFKLEHKLKIDETSKDLISKMELKVFFDAVFCDIFAFALFHNCRNSAEK